MSEDLLTDREVAPLFRTSWQQVQWRCRTGQWQHTRIGRLYLFSPEDIAAIKHLHTIKPKVTPAQSWGRKTKRAS